MSRVHKPNRLRGFTLVELLVVIAIIGVLIALLLPAVQAAREAGRRSQCSNNLKQLGLAMQNYHDVNGKFPIGVNYLHNWRVDVLPYMEQQNVYDKLDFSGASNFKGNSVDANTAVLGGLVLEAYVCPSSDLEPDMNPGWNAQKYQYHHYMGIGGAVGTTTGSCIQFYGQSCDNGPLLHNQKTGFKDITDGSSNTIIIGEQSALVNYTGSTSSSFPNGKTQGLGGYNGGWHGPGNYSKAPVQYGITSGVVPVKYAPNSDCGSGFDCGYVYINSTILASNHPTGILAASADGSVDFVSENINLVTFKNMAMRNDGQVISE